MIRTTILFIIMTYTLSACQNQPDSSEKDWTAAEKMFFLQMLDQNMFASITDLTESQRRPSNQFIVNTHYALSPQEIEALRSAEGQEGSFATGVIDRVTCTLIGMSLRNEKGEEMLLADTSQYPIYIQRFGLWDHENELSQNLGIQFRLLSNFSTLSGNIVLKLQMDGDTEKEIQVPVEISITDVL